MATALRLDETAEIFAGEESLGLATFSLTRVDRSCGHTAEGVIRFHRFVEREFGPDLTVRLPSGAIFSLAVTRIHNDRISICSNEPPSGL